MVKKEPWSFPGCLFLESRRENLKLNFVLVAVLIRQVLVNTNQHLHFCLVCQHILISCFGLCLLSLVPRPYEPAMGKPADDVLSFNLPSTFPGSYAAPSCGVRRSAAYPSSTSNDVPASANAGKISLCSFLAFYQHSLSFTCSILACSERLHESSKIFVEHALYVARIQFRTQA